MADNDRIYMHSFELRQSPEEVRKALLLALDTVEYHASAQDDKDFSTELAVLRAMVEEANDHFNQDGETL